MSTTMRRLAVVGVAFNALAATAQPQQGVEGPAPFRFGEYKTTLDRLGDPVAVAVAPDGSILVAEAGEARVRVFTADGAEQRTIADPAWLLRPQGLAVDTLGVVFIADGGSHQVHAVGPDGVKLRSWGGYGAGPGEFNDPHGLVVAGDRIYVADLGNDRIQMFDRRNGALRGMFGAPGAGDGEFNRPVDVAVDDAGFVYVADADNNRIQKFDADGDFVRAWGDYGPFEGLMDRPSAIEHRGGQLLVADTQNHRIQIFDLDGTLLLQWGFHAIKLHEGDGRLHYPSGLGMAPDGSFGVICETFENRCQVFAAGAKDQPLPARAKAIKAKQSHFGASIDAAGKLMTIAEPETHAVHIFDTSTEVPILIGTVGERGRRFGQMIRTSGLALDVERRRLYVADTAIHRLSAYNLNYDPDEPRRYALDRARFMSGLELGKLAIDAIDLRWPIEPSELEIDADGRLYMVDQRNSVIIVFDMQLHFVRAWGRYGQGPGEFRRPTDLAFSRDGDLVFVADSDNHRVQVFDRAGVYQREWGEAGDGDGAFKQVFGITAGRDGFVYVTDAAAHRVQKFTEAGVFVATWGSLGTDHGQFWKPRGIDQDERLRLIVVDQGNHRAQIFSPDGEWLVTGGTGRSFTRESERARRERLQGR